MTDTCQNVAPCLFLKPDFLSNEGCDNLIDEARRAKALSAQVVKRKGVSIDKEARRTKCANVSDFTLSFIRERFMEVKPEIELHFDLKLDFCEQPQFLVYRKGDYFLPHQDAGDFYEYPEYVRSRQISVVTFLNSHALRPGPTVFGGGFLTFFDLSQTARPDSTRISLLGERGLLVAFPSNWFHQVMQVQHGERFTIVSWFPRQNTV